MTPEFLVLKKPSDALKEFLESIPPIKLEKSTIPTEKAIGRVAAEPIISPESSPAFRRSTVDGYAVSSKDTHGSSEGLPTYLKIIGEIRMGERNHQNPGRGEAVMIYTGGMIPTGCDAVIMVENTQISRENEIEVNKPVSHGENILTEGEDLSIGEVIITGGKLIRAAEIGGLLAVGIDQVMVFNRPRVGILSSGDELVPPSKKPNPGQVRDINSSILAVMVEKYGGIPVLYEVMPDDAEIMKERIINAFTECDSLVITAGSSASTRDFTSRIIQQLGKPGILSHGINIKPGKPTILAICEGKPVIGLPGNPVSAFVIATLFVIPMLKAICGASKQFQNSPGKARINVNLASVAGREDYWPVTFTTKNGELIAEPIYFKSNLIFTLVKADGLAIIPLDANGVEAGEFIDILPVE